MALGPAVLSLASVMLGFGVAFAAVPFRDRHRPHRPRPGGLLAAVGASGSFLSANVQRLHVSGKRLKQAFGVLIVVMTTYKLFQILST